MEKRRQSSPKAVGLDGFEMKFVELAMWEPRVEERTQESRDWKWTDRVTFFRHKLTRGNALTKEETEEFGRAFNEWMVVKHEAQVPSDNANYRPEKAAVSRVLVLFAQFAPAALARVMGVALSTLYSYTDSDRPNRPGPKRLYQAAYMLRLRARDLDSLADELVSVAAESEPASRGRSGQTLPVIE